VLAYDETKKDEMNPESNLGDTLRLGMVLDGRYEIVRELGAGNIGVVYLAQDLRTKKQVAVKLLLEESLRNKVAVQMFKREAEALARIGEHPGIVGISDVGELPGGQPYFVMQYVDGIMLSAAIHAKPKGSYRERISDILEQAAEALNAAHDHGIIHRDLKPDNIMLQRLGGGREVVKIIDFGVAKVRDAEVSKSMIDPLFVGTPLYMSPEQLRREEPTAASDIYALGVIAYEMLMGRHPFEGAETPRQLLEWQKRGVRVVPSELRPGLSEEADRVILKALSYDANKRYRTAREFSKQLTWALLRGRRPRPRLVWLAATAAALLMAVVLVLLWARPGAVKPDGPLGIGSPTPTPLSSPSPAEGGSLTYWLMIVRQKDGKTIAATGRETFDTGDRFKFNLVPAQAGALYIFNQGTSGNWHVLFPTRDNNRLDARITSGRLVETEENEFTNRSGAEKGTEKIWIVWAPGPIKPLDEIVNQSADNRLTVSDPTRTGFLVQFMTEHGTPPPELSLDKEQSKTTLKGRGEIFTYSLELEHKDWK
jgi:tRNA A-37 threonylcarbamoyl transferase component Bud32